MNYYCDEKKNTSFIITLTGPSMSGKSYVMKKIQLEQDVLLSQSIYFEPVRVTKYTTRSYRIEEIRQKNLGEQVDVESVAEIPENCNLIYRTYGKEYGISLECLNDFLNDGKSPVIVINDVRVVEELKAHFPGRVLSLFLFRKIPEKKDFESVSASRGNVAKKEQQQRYEKAISIYRTYIENITLFDRVILNVKDYYGNSDEIDYTGLQIHNVIKGVIEKRIDLHNQKNNNSKKMFIISGSAASGKDEIIRSVSKLGKLQANIIPKYTTRLQEPDDGPEMICKFIPKDELIKQLNDEYLSEYNYISNCDVPSSDFIEKNRIKYENSNNKNESFEEYLDLQWAAKKLDDLKQVKTPEQRFWEIVDKNIKSLKRSKKSSEFISKYINEQFFKKNDIYIDIEKILEKNKEYFDEYTKEQEVGVSGPACFVNNGDEGFVIYKNNKNFLYAFKIADKDTNVLSNMINKQKHCLIAASLTEIFNICRSKLDNNVVAIFAYSQISAENYRKRTKEGTANEKANAVNKDIERYSKFIEYFDHVSIYAQSVYKNSSSGPEEELVDQIFRIFRAYN